MACAWRPASGVALYAAFVLQLDNPGWAGTSAAIVAQPILGASMRKAVFRLVGTAIGAAMSVVLTAIFPQDRLGFLLAVAVWCGACSFVSTVLRNFAAYAAMLAGYTLVIIAASSIPNPDHVFTLAVERASEITLGIVSAMVVMSVTDFGQSPQRLAGLIGGIVGDLRAGLASDLAEGAPETQPARRALVSRVIALDPVVDQAAGERPGLSVHRPVLRASVQGLLLALAAWRTIAGHLRTLTPEARTALTARMAAALPDARGASAAAQRDALLVAARAARGANARSASERLGLDRIASVCDGLARAFNGLALIGGVRQALPIQAAPPLLMPDLLPPLVNAFRVFAGVAAAALFVIATAWNEGYSFMIFVAVTTLLLSPQNEMAPRAIRNFGWGTLLTVALAAITKFALLPNHEGYGSFILIIACVLVPLAAVSTLPRFAGLAVPATVNFLPLLSPTNLISYDIAAYANGALAIAGGCLAGAVVLRVVPPLSPAVRTRRLLRLTLVDLRTAMRRPGRMTPGRWRKLCYGRIVALPASAAPADGSRILAALTVGLQMIALRDDAASLGWDAAPVDGTAQALSAGRVPEALAALAMLRPSGEPAGDNPLRQRALAAISEITETLRNYSTYFGAAA